MECKKCKAQLEQGVTVCPECGSEHISKMGYGTQRVEQELGDLIPSARILRMDTDTTSTKHAYEESCNLFSKEAR